MHTHRFSLEIKELYEREPNRRFTLEQIEQSLDRLVDKYCSSHESERDVGISKLIQEISYIESLSEEDRAKLIIEWTNADIRTAVTLGTFKTIDLTDSLIEAANEKRFAICALATRSLLEIASILCYLHRELRPYLTSDFFSASEFEGLRKIISKTLYGGLYDFEKVLFGDPKKALAERNWKRPKDEGLPKFNKLMKTLDEFAVEASLARVAGAVEMRYSTLSDFVHPTAASLLLYGSGKPGVFQVRQNNSDILKYLADQTVLPAYHCLAMIERLANLLSKATFLGSKRSAK